MLMRAISCTNKALGQIRAQGASARLTFAIDRKTSASTSTRKRDWNHSRLHLPLDFLLRQIAVENVHEIDFDFTESIQLILFH